ncbi:response regulator [Olivibacter ginsenosidimutans]
MMYPFIVIDDSPLDCLIVKKIISFSGKSADIVVFNDANKALEHIRALAINQLPPLTIITLDIMMPIMDGFEFLEQFLTLPETVQHHFKIIILSLSNHPYTIKRLQGYSIVEAIIEKPITIEKLNSTLAGVLRE